MDEDDRLSLEFTAKAAGVPLNDETEPMLRRTLLFASKRFNLACRHLGREVLRVLRLSR